MRINKVIVPIEAFRVGMIIKMDVASRSHVKKPYFVQIVKLNTEAKYGEVIMQTNIPWRHSLDMTVGGNWEYHHPRMSIVGYKEDFYHLLVNQRHLK